NVVWLTEKTLKGVCDAVAISSTSHDWWKVSLLTKRRDLLAIELQSYRFQYVQARPHTQYSIHCGIFPNVMVATD
ncbi:hypothetical protein O181_029637, partial [Austropuccinia psidii MF-1]|nr:hypothetical protein [Austropuccinia psidii MF-1]